jgi:hypothetical protein
MISRWVVCLVLVVILVSCVSPTTPSPTPTQISLTPSATLTSMPAPTLTPTSSPTPTPSPSPTPTPIPSPSPTPFPTWAHGFQLGIWALDAAGHSRMMQDSGITWVGIHAYPSSGTDVAYPAIAQAQAEGFRVLLRVWQDHKQITDSDYQDDFIAFLVFLAEQGADAIEVGVEPNFGWNERILSPGEYTELLCQAYAAIKEVNPATLVISGGPVPGSSWGGCTSTGCDDLLWLQGLAESGAADCLDLVGARFSSGATGPDATDGHPMHYGSDLYFFYFRLVVARYVEAFGGLRPLAFTHIGYLSPEGYEGALPSAFSWASNTTVEKQASWLTETVQVAINDRNIDMLFIYNLDRTGWENHNVDGGYALIRPDGSCPSCAALQQLLSEQ